MSAIFHLNHEKLAADPRFAGIAAALDQLSPIDSEESFNRYCHTACRLWTGQFRNPIGRISPRFRDLLELIERRSQNVIKTGWGGVVITMREDPQIEKFLVIQSGGYLALERHELKDERLGVTEGAGLILYRQPNEQSLTVQALQTKDEFHLAPGLEHCLIGTEDLLIFERSTDPKGMDQDLIFIYEPDTA